MYDQAVTRRAERRGRRADPALTASASPDAFDAKSANGTIKSATPIQVGSGPGSSATANVTADVTTATDADVYVFQASNLPGRADRHGPRRRLQPARPEARDPRRVGRVIASGVGSRPGAGDVSCT